MLLYGPDGRRIQKDMYGDLPPAMPQSRPSPDTMGRRPVSGMVAPQDDGRNPFNGGDWPSPGVPFTPQFEHVDPREWDFNPSINMDRTPRGGEENAFAMLDDLADHNDVVQYGIRSRTDETVAQEWTFIPRKGIPADHPAVKTAVYDAQNWWEKPNRRDNLFFDQWITGILRDVFVHDALTLSPKLANDGSVHSYIQIDGSTIKPLIDNFGHPPEPPFPAYQQVIKGLIRGEYTTDELIYRPTNPQVATPYGRSIVEMCLMHVVTGIRAWSFDLAGFTEGTLPEMFIEAPDVDPKSVQLWMKMLNETLAGNDQQRYRIRALPKDAKPIPVHANVWSAARNEWIARVICALFSVNPMPFVDMMARATAEVAATQQLDLGLRPLKKTIANLITELEQRRTQSNLIRFAWVEDKTDMSLDRANVVKIFLDSGLMSREFVAMEMLGLTADAMPTEAPAPGPGPGGIGGGSPDQRLLPAAAETTEAKAAGTPPAEEPLPKVEFGPFSKAVTSELATWRKVAKKHGPQSTKALSFESDAIPVALLREMKKALSDAQPEDVDGLFEQAKVSPKLHRLAETEAELQTAISAYLTRVAPLEITRAIGAM